MTRLVLVRHGQTVWHAENRYAGRSDVELTETGVHQARQLARWASTAGLTGVWCSPLRRARVTAEIATTALGARNAHVDDRLRELDFGQAEGLTSAEMQARFPAELAAFQRDPVTHHLPEGEDPSACAERFARALDDITTQHPEGRVLVVAHTTAIRLALCSLLGVPLARYRQMFPFVRNCGITEIRRDPDAPAGLARGVALLEFNTPLDRETNSRPHP